MLWSVILFLVFSFQTNAINIPNCSKSQLRPFEDLVEHVHIVGSDDRMTFDEYAQQKKLPKREVYERFAATGIVNCNDGEFTAQVTGSPSVITTAGHGFFDADCSPKTFEACSFFLFGGKSGFVEYPIDMSSIRTGGCPKGNLDRDWMVAKLEKPTSVRPYKVPNKGIAEPGLNVIQASSLADNLKPTVKSPRHLSECQIREPSERYTSVYKTDCDTGLGSSGSAQLTETADGLYMAALNVATKKGAKDGDGYDRATSHNYSIALQGDFLAAIQAAVSSKK